VQGSWSSKGEQRKNPTLTLFGWTATVLDLPSSTWLPYYRTHAARQRRGSNARKKHFAIIHFYTPAYFFARSASLDLIASAVLQTMGSDWSKLCKVPCRAVASGRACSLPPQRALSLRTTSTRRLWQRSARCLFRFMKLRERNGGLGVGGGGGEGGVFQGGLPSHFHSGFACKCRCHAAACDGVRKVSCISTFPLFCARAVRCTATSMQMHSHPPLAPSPCPPLTPPPAFALCF
jgi:hypothetical protein